MAKMLGARRDTEAARHPRTLRERWYRGPSGPGGQGPGPKGVGLEGLPPTAETAPQLRCPICLSFEAFDLAGQLVEEPEVLVHRHHGPLQVVVPDRFEDRYVDGVHPDEAVGVLPDPAAAELQELAQ